MFRKKSLFWYQQNKAERFFDWSSVIDSGIYGYQHSGISKKIKNHFKKQFITPSKGNIKAQFNKLINNYQELKSYSFFLLDSIIITELIELKEVFAEQLELKSDLLLSTLKNHLNPSSPYTLVTEYQITLNELYSNNVSLNKKNIIFYLNRFFPFIPVHINLDYVNTILVGGRAPFNLDGQKLLITRDKILIKKIESAMLHHPNLWHLAIYTEGLKNIFTKIVQPRSKKRLKLFKEQVELLKNLINNKCHTSDKITITSPYLQTIKSSHHQNFIAKITLRGELYKKVINLIANYPKELKELGNILHYRLFIPRHTICYQESSNQIDLFIHLPFEYAEHHFKNKCQDFVNTFFDTKNNNFEKENCKALETNVFHNGVIPKS